MFFINPSLEEALPQTYVRKVDPILAHKEPGKIKLRLAINVNHSCQLPAASCQLPVASCHAGLYKKSSSLNQIS